MTKVYLIGNPKAGKGRVGDCWEQMLGALQGAGLEPLGDLTQRPGHAGELAAQARRDGCELVVAAGGDGTVHEVVNGLLAEGSSGDVPALGILALGSGCDYIKTFGIPDDLNEAVARIAATDPPRTIDAGVIRYQTDEGERTRYFCNIAEVGFGPEVLRRAMRLPRSWGGAIYFAGFWLALPRFARRACVLDMGEERYEGPAMNIVIAIGQVFGGGMRVAPHADPRDGMFDVQVHLGSKLDYVRGIGKVYRGTHLPHPTIREARTDEVRIECDPPALVEADGEVIGRTPASFSILPGALRLRG